MLILHLAIGWSLTGDSHSSQPNLSLLYQVQPDAAPSNPPAYPSQYSHSHYLPVHTNTTRPPATSYPQALGSFQPVTTLPSTVVSDAEKYRNLVSTGAAAPDANTLLGLNTAYPNPNSSNPSSSGPRSTYSQSLAPPHVGNQAPSYNFSIPPTAPNTQANNNQLASSQVNNNTGGMFIGSQDVDMNILQSQNALPYMFNGEILPWLGYLPEGVANYFGEH